MLTDPAPNDYPSDEELGLEDIDLRCRHCGGEIPVYGVPDHIRRVCPMTPHHGTLEGLV